MSVDLRSRQQQVDAMRGELQKAGSRLAAERQQTDQQAAMLMEQLAIAQATSADTKVRFHINADSCKRQLQSGSCYPFTDSCTDSCQVTHRHISTPWQAAAEGFLKAASLLQ